MSLLRKLGGAAIAAGGIAGLVYTVPMVVPIPQLKSYVNKVFADPMIAAYTLGGMASCYAIGRGIELYFSGNRSKQITETPTKGIEH